jgi:hypothetical protein
LGQFSGERAQPLRRRNASACGGSRRSMRAMAASTRSVGVSSAAHTFRLFPGVEVPRAARQVMTPYPRARGSKPRARQPAAGPSSGRSHQVPGADRRYREPRRAGQPHLFVMNAPDADRLLSSGIPGRSRSDAPERTTSFSRTTNLLTRDLQEANRFLVGDYKTEAGPS